MGDLTKTTDITKGAVDSGDIAGSADKRDINSVYSKAFYDFLSGDGTDALSAALSAKSRKAATEATSGYASTMEDWAGMQSEAQRRSIEQRLAGSGIMGTDSGAGRAAIAQAIASPYAQANVEMNRMYSDQYNNYYNALLGNLSAMSQQAIVAPQLQTEKTGLGYAVDAGTAVASAAASKWSDRRLKKDIKRTLRLSRDLLKLNSYTFRYRSMDRAETGVMAQELEATSWRDAVVRVGGYRAIDTGRLSCMLLGALSDIAKRVEALEVK